MIRKLNYTNRKRIPKDYIDIDIREDNGKTYFNAVFRKDELKFPDNAKVFVEPNYGPDFLRFDFGHFSDIQQPPDTDITELKKLSDKIFFRIKIVDESEEDGLILGIAEIKNVGDDKEPEGRESLLFVNAVKMDTNEIWRVSFNGIDSMPILEINNSIEGIREVAKTDSVFIALVYPATIREIFTYIAYDLNDFDKDGEKWSAKWILFSISILGVFNVPENSDNEEECNEWIENIIKAFCIKHKILENYLIKIAV